MKLEEIRLIPSGQRQERYSLSDFNLEQKTNVGYSEGKTAIIKALANQDQRVTLYGLYSQTQEFLSGVVGYNFEHQGVMYFVILDVFTSEQHRQKSYATALYVSLVKKYGIKLISDKEQTPYGKMLWDGISRVLDVKVLDASTGDFLPRGQVSDEDIYTKQPDRYLLVAEQVYLSSLHKHLNESRLIGDGIVADHLIYTHSDNAGKYI